jgi:hypothetical protein
LSIYLLLFSDQRKTPQRLEIKRLMKVYSEKYLSPPEKLQGSFSQPPTPLLLGRRELRRGGTRTQVYLST